MADQYLSNLSITWNQGATTYNAVKIDVTDTASAADSKLMDLQVASATKIKVDKNGNQTLTSSDTGATAGPVLTLHRDSSSPAASDIMGKVLFQGEDSGGAAEDYAEIYATIVDTTATSEDGSLLARVKVAGTMTTRWTATAAGVTLTGVVDIPDGTVGAPALSFTSDPDTGLYRIGTNQVGLAAGGTKVFDSTGSATTIPLATTVSSTLTVSGGTFSTSGNVSTPGYAFVGDADTGLYRSAANTVALAAGATKAFESTASATTLPLATTISGAATLSSTLDVTGAATFASTVGVTGAATLSGGALVSDGLVSAPGLAFSGDTDTGFYRISADRIGIAAGGTYVFDSTASATVLPRATTIGGVLTATSPIRAADGTNLVPSISFTSDTDTGLYWIGANNIGIAAGGTKVFDSTASATTLPLPTTISGAATLSSTLGVTGAATLSSTLGVTGAATLSGGALMSDGAVGAPSVAFAADPDTGLYRVSADKPALAAGGVKVFDATAAALHPALPVRGTDGLVSTPAYAFVADADTGIYRIGADNIGIAAGGVKVFDSTSTATTLPLPTTISGAATLSSTLDVTGAATLSSTLGVTGVTSIANGTAGAPSLAFTSDPDTGLYRAGINEVALSAGATKVFGSTSTTTTLPLATTISGAATLSSTLDVTGIATFTAVTKVADGAVGAPGVTFNSDPDTGLYRISGDRIGLSAGGANVFDSTATATIIPKATTIGGVLTLTAAMRAADGLVGVPSLSFASDTDTGFYRIGADNIGVTVGGTKVAEFKSTGIVGARPSFLATMSTAATVTASTDTKLSFDTSSSANGVTYDTANSRFQAAVAGRWRIVIVLHVASTNLASGDLCQVTLKKNGTTVAYRRVYYGGTGSLMLPITYDLDLAATDYVEVYTQLNGSGNRTVQSAGNSTYFMGSLL